MQRQVMNPSLELPTRGNPKIVVDPNGNTTLADYQHQTGLIERVRVIPRGADIESVPSNRIQYASDGSVLSISAPDNVTITVSENANGFKQGNSALWTDPKNTNVTKLLENRHLFDANDNATGRKTKTQGTVQSRSETQFDALSRPAQTSNAWAFVRNNLRQTRTGHRATKRVRLNSEPTLPQENRNAFGKQHVPFTMQKADW